MTPFWCVFSEGPSRSGVLHSLEWFVTCFGLCLVSAVIMRDVVHHQGFIGHIDLLIKVCFIGSCRIVVVVAWSAIWFAG